MVEEDEEDQQFVDYTCVTPFEYLVKEIEEFVLNLSFPSDGEWKSVLGC